MKSKKYLLTLLVFAIISAGCSATSRSSSNAVNANVAASDAANTNAAPEATPVGANQQQADAPDTVIKDLYKTHDQKPGAIVQGKDRKIIDKYFDKTLGGLIWKDMTTNQGEVGVIDFDIFYNTQDPEIKNLNVGAAKIEGSKATVPVTFQNADRKENLTYSLVKENSGWRIFDINYGGKDSLLKYFKDAKAGETDANDSPTAMGEFEGKYLVGDTTCTVKPVKMAFEVRWEKGSGVEMFFAEGRADDRYIFASDPDTGKANSFAFDDENYNSGTFYRADGVEFKVSRIK